MGEHELWLAVTTLKCFDRLANVTSPCNAALCLYGNIASRGSGRPAAERSGRHRQPATPILRDLTCLSMTDCHPRVTCIELMFITVHRSRHTLPKYPTPTLSLRRLVTLATALTHSPASSRGCCAFAQNVTCNGERCCILMRCPFSDCRSLVEQADVETFHWSLDSGRHASIYRCNLFPLCHILSPDVSSH